jgi:hypothetical protein
MRTTLLIVALLGCAAAARAPGRARIVSDGAAAAAAPTGEATARPLTLRAEEDRVAALPGAPGPLKFGMFAG